MNQWKPGASVIGVGKTKFGPTVKTLVQLMHEAIGDALRDADLKAGDIQAVVVANFLGGPNNAQLHLNSVVAGLMPGLNLPSWRVEAACASGGVAMHQAILALDAYDPILVVGVEHMSSVPGLEITKNIGMAGDVGQPGGLEGLEAKALRTGASAFYGEDLRQTFVEDFVFPTLKIGAVYGRKYLLGTAEESATEE